VNKFWTDPDDLDDLSESDTEDESESEEKVWEVGDKAEAKWTDGEYYWGVITKVYKNGNYGFHYDDGDKSKSVPPNEVRERTPIVADDESDIPDEIGESDESNEMEVESSAAVSHTKRYYVEALTEFLMNEMTDYEFFLYGKRTNYTESFHNKCNKFYSKGTTISFEQYKMKKTFAALDWNEKKRRNNLLFDITTTLPWEDVIINEFLKRTSK